jgi:hypothetical protein
MAAQPSVTIIKTFTYRGDPELWSNTYHFDGGDPADDAEWKTIADRVILKEKAALTDVNTIVKAIGHNAGVAVAVWSYDYLAHSEEVAGTYVSSGHPLVPGDSAAWIRWSTTQVTSKGKPIYLRSYFHGGLTTGATDGDTLLAGYKTALQTYGDDWLDIMGDDSRHRAGPNGAVGQLALPSSFFTTRTLERRGKRSTSP